MIHRRGTNKSMSTTVVDLSDNPAVHYPGLKNFSFAMAVTHRLGYPIEANSSYLEFEVSQVSVDTTTGSNYTSVFTRLNMRLWEEGDFPLNDPFLKRQAYADFIYCPVEKDYKISGNIAADNFHYLSIRARKWVNGTIPTWASEIFINQLLESARVSILIFNSYIDFDDYENPIKSYIDDRYSYQIIPDLRKVVRTEIRYNKVELMDSLIDIGFHENKEFYSVERSEPDLTSINNYNEYLDFGLTIDSKEDSYERKVYSFLDLTGQIGGLYEIINIIVGMLVTFIASRLFILSIISQIYFIRDESVERGNFNCRDSRSRKVSPINDSPSNNQNSDISKKSEIQTPSSNMMSK